MVRIYYALSVHEYISDSVWNNDGSDDIKCFADHKKAKWEN